MKTILTTSCDEAAAFVRRGQLAAFPTETVYGLGADAFDVSAVGEIFRVKGRPLDNPMIVHLAEVADLESVVREIPGYAKRLLDVFVPGPLTLVLHKRETVPEEVTAGLDTVAVRVPSHPVAVRFLRACGRPVVAPSANRSGRPSPTSWEAVKEDLNGLVPCILKGDRTPVGLESTVLDCTGDTPIILREGAVGLQSLRESVPSVQPPSAGAGREARSPGLRYRHYSPAARVIVYDDARSMMEGRCAFIGLREPPDAARWSKVLVCRDAHHYAHELYHFFRECDRAGVEVIYCERPPAGGIGPAILDRIRRASEPETT